MTYVRNFTDVDDKIIRRAQEEQVSCDAITERYIAEFERDSEALGLLKPTLEPRATQHIAEIIEIINSSKRAGLAYTIDGDVFYSVEGVFRDTASCRAKKSTNWRRGRESKSMNASIRRSISPCGNRASRANRHGIAHGDRADRAGISSVRR